MEKVKWLLGVTFLMFVIPLVLNDSGEGTFPKTLMMFGGAVFSCIVFWYIGSSIKGVIVFNKISTLKEQTKSSKKAETFYNEYLKRSHFKNDKSSCKHAPEAIKELVRLGYSKDQVALVVSHAVVNYNFEGPGKIVEYVEHKILKNELR